MQLRRNRSTRSLWDPAYVDETWINDRVQLVPRLAGWVNAYYPGTLTGITEYNWGAENHIDGATAQADIFGIFGREGLGMAARWTTPASSTPTYKAMKLYRNYDGSRSTFGETSVSATVPNPDAVAAFAAQRSSDRALSVMVIAKSLSGGTPATIAGELRAQRHRAGVAAHGGQRHHAAVRCQRQRLQLRRHAVAAEHHALCRRRRVGPAERAHQLPDQARRLTRVRY